LRETLTRLRAVVTIDSWSDYETRSEGCERQLKRPRSGIPLLEEEARTNKKELQPNLPETCANFSTLFLTPEFTFEGEARR